MKRYKKMKIQGKMKKMTYLMKTDTHFRQPVVHSTEKGGKSG